MTKAMDAQALLLEIRNLSRYGWLDRPNAEFLFREIGKKAQQVSELLSSEHFPEADSADLPIECLHPISCVISRDDMDILIGACNILDVTKSEWSETDAWSTWDQAIRDGLSRILADAYKFQAASSTQPPTDKERT